MLSSATTPHDFVTRGAEPMIAFWDVARDALEEGDDNEQNCLLSRLRNGQERWSSRQVNCLPSTGR